MAEQAFDSTPPPVDGPQPAAEDASGSSGLKERIAERIRADSRDRGAVTAEHAVAKLAPELSREQLAAILAEMSAAEGHADVKALVAPSGRLYLFSDAHLPAAAAQEKGRAEEAKIAVVERIRLDSRKVVLTEAAALAPLFPCEEPERRAALLEEILADERFRDIHAVAGAGGELLYHSNDHLSGPYARIMLRTRANDPFAAVAELVRERARVQPAPTRLDVFEDPVFALDPVHLGALVDELTAKPEYADIRKMVHPTTGAVYLSSSRWLDERTAFEIMDWEEVGAHQNP